MKENWKKEINEIYGRFPISEFEKLPTVKVEDLGEAVFIPRICENCKFCKITSFDKNGIFETTYRCRADRQGQQVMPHFKCSCGKFEAYQG